MSVWGRFFSSTSAAEIRVFDSLNRIQEYSSKVTMTWMWADMSLLLQILLCYFVLDKYYICLFLFTYYYESPSDPLNMMTVHFHSALFVCDSAMQMTIQCTFGRRKHSSGSHLNEILRAPSSRSFQPSSKISRKKGVRTFESVRGARILPCQRELRWERMWT